MSNVSWYPETPRSRLNFFLRSFPIFVVLVVFLYFGLDWLGAFEFLELLIRDQSAWLMKIIFGMSSDEFTVGYNYRVDVDILTGGLVIFNEEFPAVFLDGYPRPLVIIRACTGMQAGALLMALILVTPAKWYNKVIAQVVNLLMMHIGNTFRVAFHYWFTKVLYLRYLDQGMTMFKAADLAFHYAHDMLSKVFGFIGVVIFTLVIERTGVKIVSTFGAWMDAAGEGIKRLTWKVQDFANFNRKNQKKITEDHIEISDNAIDEEISLRIEKINFYPKNEIDNNKWNFTGRTFLQFSIISGALLCLGLIPILSKYVNWGADLVAVDWFGAQKIYSEKINAFWWASSYDNVDAFKFEVKMFGTGLGLVAFLIGLIFVTPADWRKKVWTSFITVVVVFPANIFLMGFRRWAIWSLANNSDFRNDHPLMYINFADLITNSLPVIFWLIGFAFLMFLFYKLDVKAIIVVYIWLHQLYYLFLRVVGMRKKPEGDEIFSESTN